MKHYIKTLSFVFFACSGLNIECVSVAPVKIVPTTEGEESIVNAIKEYSNITEADVNQYKLLKLGTLGTLGAFAAGAASTIWGGKKVYQYAETAKGMVPDFLKTDRIPAWMSHPLFLAGLGSSGAGLMSYKALYPRIREGVLDKVQSFIDVCQGIYADSPSDSKNERYSIVNYSFNDLQLLQRYLPISWPYGHDIATYNALYNLAEQGRRAQLLLNQIGTDDDAVSRKRQIVNFYSLNLSHNVKLYAALITEENRRKREAAELGAIQAGVDLTRAKTIQTYASMVTGGIKNTRDAFKYLYDHRDLISASVTTIAAVGIYSYIKNKLGFGQE